MQDDLIERLKMHRIILKSGDYNGADLMAAWCDMINAANQGKEDNDRIAALEAKLAEKDALLLECGEALAEYACHGGPDLPCIRSKDQCRTECGKIAGDALAKIKDATDG